MILQIDSASIAPVGVLVGLMLALASIQSFALTTAGGGVAWISAFFGVLLLVAAVNSFISPEGTFAALADILGGLTRHGNRGVPHTSSCPRSATARALGRGQGASGASRGPSQPELG